MKKIFLLIALITGCSNLHPVKVTKDHDASVKDASADACDEASCDMKLHSSQ